MKKILKRIIAVTLIGMSFSLFAGSGNSFDNTVQYTNQSDGMYKNLTDVTIAQLDKSGSKYVNRTVKVNGTVIELKYDKYGNYLIVLRNGKNEIDCIAGKSPEVMLNSKVTVIGDYNGKKVAVALLTYKNNYFNFGFNG
ncbi:MAG TPA: hypothetical protein QF753_02070 [Victivallales bacterium]|nr:hypothetical protein [Victivallales bacterium]